MLGGGIYASGALTVVNSTISSNSAMPDGEVGLPCLSGEGGGIFVGGSGTLTITNSTLSGNMSQLGGGIFNSGQVTIGDTVLDAGGWFGGGTILNSGGTVHSLGYNLATDNGGGVLTGPGDKINTNPMLGPLRNNGGPTFTQALLPGSPAINEGNPSFDQRGPGHPRVVNGRIDIGSFEVQITPTPTPT